MTFPRRTPRLRTRRLRALLKRLNFAGYDLGPPDAPDDVTPALPAIRCGEIRAIRRLLGVRVRDGMLTGAASEAAT